jgi:hypothetical protein
MDPTTTALLESSVLASVLATIISVSISSINAHSLERLKSSLDETRDRSTWLYQARAEAMIGIYRRVINVDRSIRYLLETRELKPSAETSTTIVNRADNIQHSVKSFDEFYRPQKLLFSLEIADSLDKLSTLYATVPKTFNDSFDPDVWEGEVYDAVEAVAQNVPNTDDLKRALESEFRTLYGTSI